MRYVHETLIPADVEAVFAFHERPEALSLLLPSWPRTEILRPPASLEVGTLVELRVRLGPFSKRLVSEHVGYRKGVFFEDVLRGSPFLRWHHRHLFLERDSGCLLRDEVEYAPPLGPLGRLLDPLLVRPFLRRMFAHRHAVTRREVLGTGPPRSSG